MHLPNLFMDLGRCNFRLHEPAYHSPYTENVMYSQNIGKQLIELKINYTSITVISLKIYIYLIPGLIPLLLLR